MITISSVPSSTTAQRPYRADHAAAAVTCSSVVLPGVRRKTSFLLPPSYPPSESTLPSAKMPAAWPSRAVHGAPDVGASLHSSATSPPVATATHAKPSARATRNASIDKWFIN